MHARVVVVLALLALGVAGCTLLEPYASPSPEICGTDGIDEDFDGYADCEDSECLHTPACQEDDVTRCTNGVDDDGDGRTDFADATCWPEGVASVERCASILGGAVSAFPWLGLVTEVPDPDGTRYRVVRIDGSSSFPGYVTASPSLRVTGALDGLDASVELRFPAPPTEQTIVELVDNQPSRAATHQIDVVFTPNRDGTISASLARFIDGVADQIPGVRDFAPASGWFTLRFAVAGRHVTVSIDGRTPTIETDFPATFPDGPALTFVATAAEPVLLGEATMTRAPLLRCTDAPATGVVPILGLERSQRQLDTTHAALGGALEIAGRACVLAHQRTSPSTWSLEAAVDGGDGTWSTTSGFFTTRLDASLPVLAGTLPAAALALDGGGSVFAAFATDPDVGPRELRVARGDAASCTGFAVSPDLALPSIEGRVLAPVAPARYEVGPGGHRLTLVTLPATPTAPEAGQGRADLRTFTSPSGEAGTFVAVEAGEHALFDAIDATNLGERLHVPRLRQIGRDEVATVYRSDHSVELWVFVPTRGWLRVPGAELAASGEDGAFDADGIGAADLVEDAADARAWHGRLFYTGLYGDGTGEVTGVGLARLVVRAPGTP